MRATEDKAIGFSIRTGFSVAKSSGSHVSVIFQGRQEIMASTLGLFSRACPVGCHITCGAKVSNSCQRVEEVEVAHPA